MRLLLPFLFVAVMLSGCAKEPAPTLEAPEPVPLRPTPWEDGQWWTYNLTRQGEVSQVTLAASVAQERALYVSDPDIAMEPAADGRVIFGRFEDFTLVNEVMVMDFFAGVYVAVEQQMLPDVFEPNGTWDFGEGQAEVKEINGSTVSILYDAFPDRWSATYDAEVGWFTSVSFPGGTTWRLTDHGTDYQGKAWLVEAASHDRSSIGLQSTGTDIGSASMVRLTYALDCSEPGAFEMRFGYQRPVVDPIVAYQDTCPGQATRVVWIEPQGTSIEYEGNGAQARATGGPLSGGWFTLDGVRIRAIQ